MAFLGKVYALAYRKSSIFRSKLENQNEEIGSIIISVSLKNELFGKPAVRIKFQRKKKTDAVSCNYWETGTP